MVLVQENFHTARDQINEGTQHGSAVAQFIQYLSFQNGIIGADGKINMVIIRFISRVYMLPV
jgi:hypothetical protein